LREKRILKVNFQEDGLCVDLHLGGGSRTREVFDHLKREKRFMGGSKMMEPAANTPHAQSG
jgi:hypothetical protein